MKPSERLDKGADAVRDFVAAFEGYTTVMRKQQSMMGPAVWAPMPGREATAAQLRTDLAQFSGPAADACEMVMGPLLIRPGHLTGRAPWR